MYNEIFLQLKEDQKFFRKIELKSCKNDQEKEALKLRWAIEDAADTIASAIRSTNYRRGWFW